MYELLDKLNFSIFPLFRAVPRDQIICIVKLPLVGQAYTVQYVSGGGAGYCIRSFWLKPNKENETSIPDCTA